MTRRIAVLLLATIGCSGDAPGSRTGVAARSAALDSGTRTRADSGRRGVDPDSGRVEEDRPCFASKLGLPCAS